MELNRNAHYFFCSDETLSLLFPFEPCDGTTNEVSSTGRSFSTVVYHRSVRTSMVQNQTSTDQKNQSVRTEKTDWFEPVFKIMHKMTLFFISKRIPRLEFFSFANAYILQPSAVCSNRKYQHATHLDPAYYSTTPQYPEGKKLHPTYRKQ